MSLDGPLKELQRFLCKSCSRSFTLGRKAARPRARFSDDVVLEAVRLYVQGLASHRVLSNLLEHRIGRPVSRFTLNTWVDEIGAHAKTPLQTSMELAPRWGGFLGVDGKAISIAGEKHCLLIGVDYRTQDIVHAFVCEKEEGDEFARLVIEARLDAGHSTYGLVTDYGKGFEPAHAGNFPGIPWQLCRVHLDRHLDTSLPQLKHSELAPLQAELKARIRAILYADSYDQAARLWYRLSDDRKRFANCHWHRGNSLKHLQGHFNLYMTHHRVEGLPPDTNFVENVIKQLGKKLRLMEGFATLESADRFCRLLVGCYRFKRFTGSRNGTNGKAPLQVAGVDLKGRDWLTFLLDS